MRTRRAIFILACGLFAILSPARASIPDEIDSILAGAAVAGNSWSILVENASGSVIYYQRNPTNGLAPGSNTKLYTTSAAIGLLGTNYAFQTRIYGNGTLTGGVLTGDLNLVCEHDPTWNTSVFSGNARKPLDTIATALQALGLTTVTGNVQCYGLCAYDFGSNDELAATTTAANNLDAATAFVAALAAKGISVSGSALGQTGFSPPGTLLHTYYSTNNTYGGKPLRLDVVCIALLKPSHAVMADCLLRHLGWKLTGTDSYTAGRNQVIPWLKNGAGLNTNGLVMNDGSGFSHDNHFSARQTVDLIRYMLAAFPSWDDGLPIGCVDGTLRSRFCGTDGSGTVHAKTGSLSIAIALSGYIDNPYDNQRYLFSFIGNNSGVIDLTATRHAMDSAVVLFGAPAPPQLSLPEVNLADNTATLTWTASAGLKYRIQFKTNLNDAAWQNVPGDVTATNIFATKLDTLPAGGAQRFYRVQLVD